LWSERQVPPAWLPLIGLASVIVTLLAASLFRSAEKTLLRLADGMVLPVLRKD
jgi:hypothetical protein